MREYIPRLKCVTVSKLWCLLNLLGNYSQTDYKQSTSDRD